MSDANRLHITVGVDGCLHARIIAAIAKADQDWCSDNPLYEDMADAVIAELGLTQECSWHVPVSKWAPANPKHVRYVTEWNADNKSTRDDTGRDVNDE